jgi:hypothetical protein
VTSMIRIIPFNSWVSRLPPKDVALGAFRCFAQSGVDVGSVFASLDLGAPSTAVPPTAALPPHSRRAAAAPPIPTRLPLSLTVTQRSITPDNAAAAAASTDTAERTDADGVEGEGGNGAPVWLQGARGMTSAEVTPNTAAAATRPTSGSKFGRRSGEAGRTTTAAASAVVDSPRDVLPPLGMGMAGDSGSGSGSDGGNGGVEQHASTRKPPRQRSARRQGLEQGLSKEFAGWVPAAMEERASAAGRCVHVGVLL